MIQVKSKQPHVGTTIFTVMSKLATDMGALNLAQGFPSFNCSPELIDLVSFHLKKGHNQYAPMAGVPALKEAIAEKTADLYKVNYHPENEVTVVSGATEALYAAITAVVRPNDEVIVFEPAYDSYAPSVELNGGILVYITLKPPHYQIDWEVVKQKITPQTRLIMLNTPHNPTGKMLSMSDLNYLAEIVRDTNIFIISDEVYEHITFDGRPHISLMMHPTLQERTFICGSFGKTFHITGWKIGYCLAPKDLSVEFRKAHQWITFATSTPMQYALADFLKKPENYLAIPDFYQKKRDKFLSCIQSTRFTYTPAEGSFFQTVSYSGISEENDYDLAIRLTKEIGVASIPVSVFYHQKNDYKILRFCFAKDDGILEQAGERLRKI
ncbi:methionine aminotransferase [Thermoflexibacter ruber]|uniref:2-keto-4-methylthiobutyrate aminotransferase apoenzyme n=1 Tax=Thermoflexibacter ruber TaxID=1003 RepID=A0A1I2JNL3_9BACT|nr:methionine aminotransferase [Thermoflexibacter ruber]SFF55520.1 2-keto-4-methylthiobutyrate aminotransferase apoenzyme [Thermoflexibacter ruber]